MKAKKQNSKRKRKKEKPNLKNEFIKIADIKPVTKILKALFEITKEFYHKKINLITYNFYITHK
jgi:hypothetical protein